MGASGGTPSTVLSSVAGQLVTGQEVFSRGEADTVWGGPTTGNMRLTYFRARKSETSTKSRINTGDQGAAATPTLCKIGLFLISSAGDGTRVAVTGNETALFAAPYTRYTPDWIVPYDVVAGLWYAQAVLVVSAGATPHYIGSSPGLVAEEVAEPPSLAKELLGQADIPASFIAANLSHTSYRVYGVVLP